MDPDHVPSCHTEHGGAQDEEVGSSNYGMLFQRMETSKSKSVGSFNKIEEQAYIDSSDRSETYSEASDDSYNAISPSEDEWNGTSDNKISEYTRVRLLDDLYSVVGLKKRENVMANFGVRGFLTREISKAMDTSVGCSIPPPILVAVQIWVCCRCGWRANAATSVQCPGCYHGFDISHCTQESH